jgi:ribonuclease HII
MRYIIGSDEVGYGAWAGPLVVCAVAVPVGWAGPPELDDSKKLGPIGCAELYHRLQDLSMFIAGVESQDIDKYGVKMSLVHAHSVALRQLLQRHPDAEVIVDGIVLIPDVPQARCVPRADSTYPAVMAASIIAKVNRDFMMRQYHKQYPHYGFDTNVGYSGKKGGPHAQGLARYGPCPIHRRSYAPVREALAAQRQTKLFEEP